jgi:acetate kinase
MEWRENRARLEARTASGAISKQELERGDRAHATEQLLEALVSGETRVLRELAEIDIVGHRIVNGGREFTRPTRITREVKAAIEKMAAFAPLHNRVELEGIALVERKCGSLPQVAVFDTAFHSGLSEAAAIYPGPYEWAERGIRKLGFHGINHEYCAGRAAQMLRKDPAELKLVTCHLGNGCSLAAIRGGKSIDTTMGFTPLEGLMMGTRSGSVDPGILTFLLREGRTDGRALDEMLNTKSGLLGISGVSSDMREIMAAIKNGNERSRLAFEMFIHRLQSGIGAMVAALNGVDAIVFTAGIGENSPEVRAAACSHFTFLGLVVDLRENAEAPSDKDIATQESTVRVLVIRAQEDWAIARECWKLESQPRAASSN